MSRTAPDASARAARMSAGRFVAASAIVFVGLLLLVDLASLLKAAVAILPFPYGMDYGEGIVWQQTRDMTDGTAYGPLGVFPAIVYHYPPVFHLVSGVFASAFGLDGLLAGRLVSLLSTLVSAALVGWLAAQAVPDGPRNVRLICGALAGLACFASGPIVFWAPLMRVDALACAFSLAGLVLAARALDRSALIHAASLAFVLAVYTKQVSIAAPAAAFIVLLRVRPALAWRLAAGCTLIGSAILAVLYGLTDGRFVRHVFLYNVNRLDLDGMPTLLALLALHASLAAVAILGLYETRRAWMHRGSGRPEIVAVMAAIFLAIKTAMLPMMLKSGAASNYLVEWGFALAIFIGPALRPLASIALCHALPGSPRPRSLPAMLVAMTLALAAGTAWRWSVTDRSLTMDAATLKPIVDAITASSRPVVSDDMTLQIRAGHKVMWEPAIAAELAHAGLYDEAGFATLVRSRAFGLFVTERDDASELSEKRYNPAVVTALADAYPTKRRIGRFTLHLPIE